MTVRSLVFKGFQFSIVDRNGTPWLKASEVAQALEYSSEDSIGRLYRRNSDEFTPEMSDTIKVAVSGNLETETRIFSPRGCHLLAMLARTNRAKEFRIWVLDVLEKHITPEKTVLDGKGPAETATQLAAAFKAVLEIADGIGLEGNQRLLSADQAAKALTGISPLTLLGVPALTAPIQEPLLTPSDIGKELGISAQKVNRVLELNQLQIPVRDHGNKLNWELTDTGKAFGVYLDTGKKNGSGAPIRQLKWHRGVLKAINADLI